MILRAAAVWTVVIWLDFTRRILGDSERGTGFKVVHSVLAVISIAFAVAMWRVVMRNRGSKRG